MPDLQGVAATLLIPLYGRATESKRPDGLLRDTRAEELVARLDYDFGKVALHGNDQAALMIRTREFDRIVRDFLSRHPDGVVVHLGCGLDSRFERVDNGKVTWFDLDLPEVVTLRRQVIGDDPTPSRYHLLSGSAFDPNWLDEVAAAGPHPVLALAEAVLVYFPGSQVKELFAALAQRFPGVEMATDAYMPWSTRVHNLQLVLMRSRARLRWGLRRPTDVESWGPGFRLLRTFYYFDEPEPRMRGAWMRHINLLGRSVGIFHYRLAAASPLPIMRPPE